MNADLQVVQDLFAQAIEFTDISQRNAFLSERCAGNVELYERIVKLLVAFEGSKGFLDQPTNKPTATDPDLASGYQQGHLIAGKYKLLEAIGEGGMGTVWVAEQTQPIRRKVALKLVKPGMDSKQVLARFDAERQALALMDHPNIAKVFDGGAADQGRPFFAMEYVKGMPLTQYCDQMRLSVEERLNLFVPICQAVQHAHQKGIIHRDLKPSNVLICLYDGKPVPKVIDFGLAKAMYQPLTEQTVHTGHGLMIGTPLYMSPEQAEHNNLDVDTRTDVYSLGVMLYELLTGSTPLERAQFKDAAFGEILRLIKEVEPPKPSTRVSSSAQLSSIAAQRNLDPTQLGRSFRGDLDWIVMKAIDKERDRRYETANGLARDLERFLSQEVVEACPPSYRYRLGKALRRNRKLVMAATAIGLALLMGFAGTTWGLLQARAQSVRAQQSAALALAHAEQAEHAASAELAQRKRADSEAAAAKAVRDFLQEDLLRQSSIVYQAETISMTDNAPPILIDPTIKQMLNRAAKELEPGKIEAKFDNNRFVQAEVLRALGDAYIGVDPNQAIEPLRRAIDLYHAELGEDALPTLAARNSLGIALTQAWRDAEAADVLKEVLDARIRILGLWDKDTVVTRDFYGRCLLATDPEQAVGYFDQLSKETRTALGQEHLQYAKARFHLAWALYQQSGQFSKALPILEEVVKENDQQNVRGDHPFVVAAESVLIDAYGQLNRTEDAIYRLEKTLTRISAMGNRDDEMALRLRRRLAWQYLGAGMREEAIKTFEDVIASGTPGPNTASSMEALAHVLSTSDVNRALELLEQARLMRSQFQDELQIFSQPSAIVNAKFHATLLFDSGHFSKALTQCDQLIEFLTANPDRKDVGLSEIQALKLRCQAAAGDLEIADAAFGKLVRQLEETNDSNLGETLRQWGLVHEGKENFDRAAEITGRLVELRRTQGFWPILGLGEALRDWGRKLVKAGRPLEAEPVLREALKEYQKFTPNSWMVCDCRAWLSCAVADQAGRDEAEQMLVEVFRELTEKLDQTPVWGLDRRLFVAQRLAQLYRSQGKSDEAEIWQEKVESLNSSLRSSQK